MLTIHVVIVKFCNNCAFFAVCSSCHDTLCDENRSDCPLVYNEEWGKILIIIPHIKKIIIKK